MKTRQDKSFHRPFSDLKVLVEKKQLNLPSTAPIKAGHQPPITRQQEKELFTRTMGDVTPLVHNRHWQPPHKKRTRQATPNHEPDESVVTLERLIRTGHGFVVAQTDEYMEACRPGVNPRIIKKLHQGRFTVQNHIDLHGLFAREAEPILHQFIKDSVQRGCQTVLIIHGRGLKSPHKPILKSMVFDWLTRGPLRSYVMALASARACDGGAGATYVLLRHRPIGKRQRCQK
jgi:DNA-nicking Smr family endonuclease